MSDYISREAARPDAFCEGVSCQDCPFCKDPVQGGCRIDDFVKSIPAADVAPVRHGRWVSRWICSNMAGYYYACRCSECNKPTYKISTLEPMLLYCPNCGAKMDGGQDDV